MKINGVSWCKTSSKSENNKEKTLKNYQSMSKDINNSLMILIFFVWHVNNHLLTHDWKVKTKGIYWWIEQEMKTSLKIFFRTMISLKNYLKYNRIYFALEIYWYSHQKYKNRKPDRKPDPGLPGKFYEQMNQYIKRYLPLLKFFW